MIKFILSIVFYIIFINIALADNGSIYSFKNIKIDYEDKNSYIAKEHSINKTIENQFNQLLNNLIAVDEKKIIENENINSKNYLKNIVIKNEIVTEKKYIAEIDIFFDKDKLINFYKKNKIPFSDTISPNFLILTTYNFDGSDILWENENWYKYWNNYQKYNNQITITIPDSDNKNKVLLSSKDISDFNFININKILNYYNLENAILITANKEYNPNTGKIYIKLLLTLYQIEDKKLENIFFEEIYVEKFIKKDILEQITKISYNKILDWWKNKTITHFTEVNKIDFIIENKNIKSINKIKNMLLNMSQINDVNLLSINKNEIKYEMIFFGDVSNLENILLISNIILKKDKNNYYIYYESI